MDARRGAGGATALLARATGGSPGGVGVAVRPAAASGAKLSGTDGELLDGCDAGGKIAAVEPGAWRDSVHDAAGGIPSVADTLQRTRRHCGGPARGETASGRDRMAS